MAGERLGFQFLRMMRRSLVGFIGAVSFAGLLSFFAGSGELAAAPRCDSKPAVCGLLKAKERKAGEEHQAARRRAAEAGRRAPSCDLKPAACALLAKQPDPQPTPSRAKACDLKPAACQLLERRPK